MSIEVNGVVLSDMTAQYLETILWAETVYLPVPNEELINDCMDVDEAHPLHGVTEHDYLEVSFSLADFTVKSLEGPRMIVSSSSIVPMLPGSSNVPTDSVLTRRLPMTSG